MDMLIIRARCVHLVVEIVPAIVTLINVKHKVLAWHSKELKPAFLICLGLQDDAIGIVRDTMLL